MKTSKALTTICLLPILISLSACSQNRAHKQLTSGIEGQVLLGPMSAVVSSDKPVLDQPYKARISILDANRENIIQFESDEEGRFRVPLEPGDYFISPIAPNAPNLSDSLGLPSLPKPPYPEEQKVTVKSGRYTQIVVRYDTGIR